MKTDIDQSLTTTDITETLVADIPVNSPSIYAVDVTALLQFGQDSEFGGVIRLRGRFRVDNDFHAWFIDAPDVETNLLSGTLRGIATNLQVPRLWFGVVDPVDDATPAIRIYAQGPPNIFTQWRVFGVAQSL